MSKPLSKEAKTTSFSATLRKKVSTDDNKNLIREKPVKPPGASKFTRKIFSEVKAASNVYENKLPTDVNRDTICQQLLVDGYPASYIELFNLTVTGEYDSKDLSYLHDNLIQIELSTRSNSVKDYFIACENISTFYRKHRIWVTAIQYCQKYLIMAKTIMDIESEIYAIYQIGILYLHIGTLDNIQEAISYFTLYNNLAVENDMHYDIKKSNYYLTRAYIIKGLYLEIHQSSYESYDTNTALNNSTNEYEMLQINNILECWQYSLHTIKLAYHRLSECEINIKIGLLFLQTQRIEEALPYFQITEQKLKDNTTNIDNIRLYGLLLYCYDILHMKSDKDALLTKLKALYHEIHIHKSTKSTNLQICINIFILHILSMYSCKQKLYTEALPIYEKYIHYLKLIQRVFNPNEFIVDYQYIFGNTGDGTNTITTTNDIYGKKLDFLLDNTTTTNNNNNNNMTNTAINTVNTMNTINQYSISSYHSSHIESSSVTTDRVSIENIDTVVHGVQDSRFMDKIPWCSIDTITQYIQLCQSFTSTSPKSLRNATHTNTTTSTTTTTGVNTSINNMNLYTSSNHPLSVQSNVGIYTLDAYLAPLITTLKFTILTQEFDDNQHIIE